MFRTHRAGSSMQPTLYPSSCYLSRSNSGRHRSAPFVSTQTIYDVSIASNLFNYLNSKSS